MARKKATPAGPQQDEKILAALSHASALLPFWGIIASIVIWATQKDKSKFVAFQALQAVAYQFVGILGFLLTGVCYMCSIFAFPLMTAIALPTADSSADFSPLALIPMTFPFAVMALAMLVWVVFVAYGIVGAVLSLQGKDFRYLLVGRRLVAYLDA